MKTIRSILFFCMFLSVSILNGAPLEQVASGKGGALHLAGTYLYAVLDGKLCTYDVSKPLAPTLVSQVAAAGNRQMVSSGKRLYLSCRSRGVQIFSLDEPAHPTEISHFYPSELATGLTVSGDVLAVTLRIYGVEFFDVSNPAKVRPLGLLRTGEAQSAAFFGSGRIAIGDWGSMQVVIGDVSDLCRPSILSRLKLDGLGDGVWVQGNWLYAATGMNAAKDKPQWEGRGHGLEIFDISDVSHLRQVGAVKFAVNPKAFPDWWSVKVSGNTAFVSDTGNGVYVVDVTDKSHPVILDNITLPQDSSSQIAVGNGVVYVSGHNGGLYLFRHEKAKMVSPEEADIRIPAVDPVPPVVSGVRNIPLPGFVWSLAKWDSMLYAACAQDGAKEFHIASDGSLVPKRTFPFIAMDCAVSEKLLIIAADQQLVIMERSTGRLLSSTAAPEGAPFLQLRLFNNQLCTASRTGRLYLWDISDPSSPKLIGEVSGGGLLYGDMLPERSVKGRFPVNWHSRFVRWYDADGKECGQIPELHRFSHQQNGITEIDGKFLFLGRKECLLLSPDAPEKYTRVPMNPCRSGIPTSDGHIVAVSNRRNGEVYFYEFDGKMMREISGRRILLPSTLTGRVVFHNGKAYIPAGYRGIYFE